MQRVLWINFYEEGSVRWRLAAFSSEVVFEEHDDSG